MATFGQNGRVLKRVDLLNYDTTDFQVTETILSISSDEYAFVRFHTIEMGNTIGGGGQTTLKHRFDGGTKEYTLVDASVNGPFTEGLRRGLEELRMPPDSTLVVMENGSGSQTVRIHATVEIYVKVG